jgi:hypothetical protein
MQRTHNPTIQANELTSNDILLGRGSGTNEHNKFFRNLVAKNKSKYEAATTREDRTAVIMETVSLIKNSKGRFLKLLNTAGGTHHFEVIDNAGIIKAKMKQAFRYSLGEKRPRKIVRELNFAKKDAAVVISSSPQNKEAVNAASVEVDVAVRVMPKLVDPPTSLIHAIPTFHPSISTPAEAHRLSGLQPSMSNDHSVLVDLLLERALAERARSERDTLMAMQLQQALAMQLQQGLMMQESSRLGLFLQTQMQESPILGLLLQAHSQRFSNHLGQRLRLSGPRFSAFQLASNLTNRSPVSNVHNGGVLVQRNRNFPFSRVTTSYLQPDF